MLTLQLKPTVGLGPFALGELPCRPICQILPPQPNLRLHT